MTSSDFVASFTLKNPLRFSQVIPLVGRKWRSFGEAVFVLRTRYIQNMSMINNLYAEGAKGVTSVFQDAAGLEGDPRKTSHTVPGVACPQALSRLSKFNVLSADTVKRHVLHQEHSPHYDKDIDKHHVGFLQGSPWLLTVPIILIDGNFGMIKHLAIFGWTFLLAALFGLWAVSITFVPLLISSVHSRCSVSPKKTIQIYSSYSRWVTLV